MRKICLQNQTWNKTYMCALESDTLSNSAAIMTIELCHLLLLYLEAQPALQEPYDHKLQ